MQNHPFLLGQVRLAQIPSWGPGTAPAPMLPMEPAPQAAPAGFELAPAPPFTGEAGDLTNAVYAGGAIVAIMAAIGALLA